MKGLSRFSLTFCIVQFLTCPLVAASTITPWDALGKIQMIGPGITPAICIDPTGTLHVVAMNEGSVLHRRRGAAGAFEPAKSVPVPEGVAVYNSPHLVSDAHGVLHLVFERDFAGNSKKAWYSRFRDAVWSSPIIVVDRTGTERRVNYPRLAVDKGVAYVGAFTLGGSTLVKIADVDGTPQVVGTVETALWVVHPFVRNGEMLAVGRAGTAGHRLERYSADLVRRGEPLLLSRGSPTKTYEPTGAMIDDEGVVHVAGVAGLPIDVLWYNTDRRAAKGEAVILGPELVHDVGAYTFPLLLRDKKGRVYLSYRDHATGEGRLTVLEPEKERFAPPITVAPAVARRLRWNPHIAAASNGGAWIVWDDQGQVFLRAVGEAASER